MGQRPAAGGKNKLCFVVLCKAAQGVLCHVVGVAVGAEDNVRPQLPRRKGGRIAAAGTVGAGQVAEHRVDAKGRLPALEKEAALPDVPDGELGCGQVGGGDLVQQGGARCDANVPWGFSFLGRNIQMNRLFNSNIWFMGPEPWPRSSMADKQPEM